ncbi:MAG: hypothetical protein CMC81_02785 [Flavobacteriaceae bacterium]|nr:hypothetical protein [Flavobacteriaceae bacterium]|tara:strand:+ start:1661 stop:1891 length:231 start_codon:yes stop_codon:yes gene_type:complete
MNKVEKFLRKNDKFSAIIYFTILVYFIFDVYSYFNKKESIINVPEIIDTSLFFFFLYMTYIVVMIQKDIKNKKSSK